MGKYLGRFDLLEERDGSPVYKQVHSREMPETDDALLFRWENGKLTSYLSTGPKTSGWLKKKEIGKSFACTARGDSAEFIFTYQLPKEGQAAF